MALTPSTSLSRAICATCAHNGARAVGSRIIKYKYADQHVGPRVDPGAGAPPAASSLGDSIAARRALPGRSHDPTAARRRADCIPAPKIAQIIENAKKKKIAGGGGSLVANSTDKGDEGEGG